MILPIGYQLMTIILKRYINLLLQCYYNQLIYSQREGLSSHLLIRKC